MKMFGTINKKDYSVQEVYSSAPMSWELVSSSYGVEVTSPEFLQGAVIVNRANLNAEFDASDKVVMGTENPDTGFLEYSLHKSIRHLFYDRGYFYTHGAITTSSISGLPDDMFVISIGQSFYGDRIKPGSFSLTINEVGKTVSDDAVGNLYVSQSGTGSYVGNIFYSQGIAVVKHDTGSVSTEIGLNGLKLISGSFLYVDYESDVKYHRHETVVTLKPTDYNMSVFNPSMKSAYQVNGALTASLAQNNIIPISGSNIYSLYNLMASRIIKPYITTVGLYNDKYELVAVAKLANPIQRTFDINQIFIIRFDT
jgi:hypothetical protein